MTQKDKENSKNKRSNDPKKDNIKDYDEEKKDSKR